MSNKGKRWQTGWFIFLRLKLQAVERWRVKIAKTSVAVSYRHFFFIHSSQSRDIHTIIFISLSHSWLLKKKTRVHSIVFIWHLKKKPHTKKKNVSLARPFVFLLFFFKHSRFLSIRIDGLLLSYTLPNPNPVSQIRPWNQRMVRGFFFFSPRRGESRVQKIK